LYGARLKATGKLPAFYSLCERCRRDGWWSSMLTWINRATSDST